jgi:hypothetical protein
MDVLMDVSREKDDKMRRRRKKGKIDQIDLFIYLFAYLPTYCKTNAPDVCSIIAPATRDASYHLRNSLILDLD